MICHRLFSPDRGIWRTLATRDDKLNQCFTTQFERLVRRFPGSARLGHSSDTHLFHAPNSVCSQKVRVVLHEMKRPYVSHELNVIGGDTYEPEYVSMRLTGCAGAGLRLATSHGVHGEGSTSVELTGCDPCAVPMIVDVSEEKIYVDSRAICLMLTEADTRSPPPLVPTAIRADIERQLSIVDNLPNYQLLAILVAGQGEPGAKSANSFSTTKVERCDALIERYKDDVDLVRAYSAKRRKELLATNQLFNATAIARARGTMRNAVDRLDQDLASGNCFLFGDCLTLADLFWAVEMVRLVDLEQADLWQGGRRPRVERYVAALCAEPSVEQAIIEWPGARLGRASRNGKSS